MNYFIFSIKINFQAAHCVYDEVRVYENPLTRPDFNDTTGHLLDPEDLFPHENYDESLISNDIALLYVKNGLKIKNFINLPPPSLKFEDLIGKKAIIPGYGDINDKRELENRLKFAELTIDDGKRCKEIHNVGGINFFEETKHICLGVENEKDSTCR